MIHLPGEVKQTRTGAKIMSNPVKDLENAIKQLSEDQLQNFREWFDRFDAKRWDEKIEKDSASGKLDSLINKAIAEHKDGKTKRL
jgi:hypothetical protein